MLNEMKYVYAVYQEKSFTKAARKLFISQPALSNMVKKAEQEIGVPIFDRSTVPLTLTREGEVYIRAIRQIMRTEKNLQTYFDDIRELNTGTLSVGGSSFFCSFVLPDLIGRFSARYPRVSIDLLEGNIKELREGLDNESLDLIIETSVKEDDPTLDTFLYKVETIILAVPVDDPINDRFRAFQIQRDDLRSERLSDCLPTPVPLSAFRELPFVLLKEGNDLSSRSAAMCREAGFSPKVAIRTDQMLTAANIGASGMGALFVRADLLRYLPIADRFCLYALGSERAQRKIFFATKKGRYISSAAKTFLHMAGAVKVSGERRKKEAEP